MLRLLVYLSKRFLGIWLGVVFGFLILIGLLDSLANGADIVGEDGSFADTFRYMALRAPVIFDRIFVFTFVVAILLVFVQLIRNHELVALLGFGISVPKQVALLVPVVFLASVVSVLAIDTLTPPAVRSLQAWGIGEYKQSTFTEEDPLRLDDGNRIVIASDRPDFNTLGDLQIFSLTETGGQIKTAIWAETARFLGDAWELNGVRTLDIMGADGETRLSEIQAGPSIWRTSQTPESIARLAAEPRDLSLSDMNTFRMDGNSGNRPRSAYSFWHSHRLTRPIAILILLVGGAAIMQRVGRQDTGDKALITGIALGFLFLIVDGAMATFAASGAIPPLYAITMPLVVFGLLGGWLLLRTESL